MTVRRHRGGAPIVAVLATALMTSLAAGCSGGGGKPAAPATGAASTTSTGAASESATPTPTAGPGSPAPPVRPTRPSKDCLATTAGELSARQQAGQLVMVALHAGSPAASLRPTIGGQHVGNVVYLGGWSTGMADVSATSRLMQRQATASATGGIPLLIAADQEGGAVQQLKGAGFTPLPAAIAQAARGPATIESLAVRTGRELAQAGVNVNFAPVADVVPADLGRGNGPIGQWGREYGHDPASVTAGTGAVLRGLQRSGVAATLKHFPGIGRIRGNTDFTATGVVDTVTTRTDPYLEPFRRGVAAGAPLVMVSSATYSKIDPANPAMFSPTVIDGMLRGDLGFRGVAITDDINAVAVRGIPASERATRFIAAGGDIVLTGDTASAPTLVSAIAARTAADPAFAGKVAASLTRVLALKRRLGLICN